MPEQWALRPAIRGTPVTMFPQQDPAGGLIVPPETPWVTLGKQSVADIEATQELQAVYPEMSYETARVLFEIGKNTSGDVIYDPTGFAYKYSEVVDILSTTDLTFYQLTEMFGLGRTVYDPQTGETLTTTQTIAIVDPKTGERTEYPAYKMKGLKDYYRMSQPYRDKGQPIPESVQLLKPTANYPYGDPRGIADAIAETRKRAGRPPTRPPSAPQIAMGALEEIYQAQLPKVPAQQAFYKKAIGDIYAKFEQAVAAGQYPAPTDVKAKERQWEEFLGQYPFREEYLQLPVKQRERPSQFAPRTRWLDY